MSEPIAAEKEAGDEDPPSPLPDPFDQLATALPAGSAATHLLRAARGATEAGDAILPALRAVAHGWAENRLGGQAALEGDEGAAR